MATALTDVRIMSNPLTLQRVLSPIRLYHPLPDMVDGALSGGGIKVFGSRDAARKRKKVGSRGGAETRRLRVGMSRHSRAAAFRR
jgi:hypothetical protein